MSAIAGLIRLDEASVDRTAVVRMMGLIAPAGADAQHAWFGSGAGLAHALLRITPEDVLERQPLVDAASGDVLLFDGRIDNREDLARELSVSMAELARLSDSDLVLRACLRWDVAAVEHLVGDFAMAVWQPARRRLWMARDPLGHRPLFWHRQDGFFAFASMPKALFAVPGVPRALCEERLAVHLALLPQRGPETFFKDVFRVEPASLMVLHEGRITSRRYHRFDHVQELVLPRDDDYVEALREQLDRAVGARLRVNGPIAAQLSSGFDSSTIVATAARLLAQRNQGLIAYTALPREGFAGAVPRGRHADESAGAQALAKRFSNIEHVLVRSTDGTLMGDLRSRTESLDRPSFNPCNMPWWNAILADAQSRGVKSLLQGQMGNMTISYDGMPGLGALVGSGHWLQWWREAGAVRRVQKRGWPGLALQSFGPFVPRPLWMLLEALRRNSRKLTDYTALNPSFVDRMKIQDRARGLGWDLSYRPWADGRRMRIAVLERQDPTEIYLQANTDAGLDLREPLSDVRLIAFCLSVPDRQYLHEGENRWLLRRLMADVLPPEITESRTKGLQSADWYETMADEMPRLREELANLAAHGGVGEYLDLDSMTKALDAWPTTGFATENTVGTYRLKLLRGIAAGEFIRYVDDNNR